MSNRMPVVYLPHGGGPWPFVDMGLDPREVEALTGYLQSLRRLEPPRALLVVSAHWESAVPTVMTSAAPPLLFDYYGFPPASYQLQWPAPGDPELAQRVRALVERAGFQSAEDPRRGFDHGTFVPLKVAFPEANLPTVQLSLLSSLDPAQHLALGRALAPLRDENILILGSGMSFHNLRAFRDPRAPSIANAFDAWLQETVTLDATKRDTRLTNWTQAPAARAAHPREEHLLPLMVVAGAAGDDTGRIPFSDTFMSVRITAAEFG